MGKNENGVNVSQVNSAVEAACKAAIQTIVSRLAAMTDGQKVTQTDLHRMIGQIRTVETETTNEDGTVTKSEAEVVDRFDLVKACVEAFETVHPGHFTVETKGKGAGVYRGGKPAPRELSTEEKAQLKAKGKADRDAMKAKLASVDSLAAERDALAAKIAELTAKLGQA